MSKMKKNLTLLVIVFFLASLSPLVASADNSVKIMEVKGLVQLQRLSEQEWIKAEENAELFSGDKIRSFLESSAKLIFPDQSEFTLGENSSLDIKDVSQNPKTKTAKRELKLNLGKLHYKVPPSKEKASDFKVHSSTAIVGITGTEGTFVSHGDGKPSENILIEGNTYNTDDEGGDPTYQTAGNVYNNDGDDSDMYGTDTQQETEDQMGLDQEYVDMIKNLIAQLEEKKQQGYDLSEIEPLIDEAFTYLESRQYVNVKEVVDLAISLLEKAEKLDIPSELKEKIENIIAQTEQKEVEGYNTAEIYALLDEIHQKSQDGNFDEIENLIILISQKLESLTKDEDKEEGDHYLNDYQHLQEVVLDKETKGFVLEEVKSLLRQSFVYYENNDLARAYTLLGEAEEKLELVLKELPENLKNKIAQLQQELNDKKAQGYKTDELELIFNEITRLIEEESFLRVQELVSEIETKILNLEKDIPADLEVKLVQLREEIEYKKSLGFDLTALLDNIQALEKYVEDADIENIEATYALLEDALAQLTVPAGFEADFNVFLEALKEKEDSGFDVKEVAVLKEKIDAAVEQGDINLARSFLEQAKTKLAEIVDSEPPNLQILIFEETADAISVEGFASDNVKLDNVKVNNSVVDVTGEGKFTFSTIPAVGLEKITIVAEDISGNISPAINLDITVEAVDAGHKGEIQGASIEYVENAFIVKGTFIPGGKVTVGTDEALCDGEGHFAATIDSAKEEFSTSIAIVGTNGDGTTSPEVVLSVEDKKKREIFEKQLRE